MDQIIDTSRKPQVNHTKKMPAQGLNRLAALRRLLVGMRRRWLVSVFGMDLHPTVELSLRARLDKTYPKGVHIGARSYVAFDAAILTHDRTRGLYLHTRVGRDCFIGARSLILPGVEIGNGSIVGAGAVVTRCVPPGCIVAGNPARIVKRGIEAGPYGRLPSADDMEHRLAIEE